MMIDDTAARQRAAALKAVDAARRRGGGAGIDVVDAYALTWQQCWCVAAWAWRAGVANSWPPNGFCL